MSSGFNGPDSNESKLKTVWPIRVPLLLTVKSDYKSKIPRHPVLNPFPYRGCTTEVNSINGRLLQMPMIAAAKELASRQLIPNFASGVVLAGQYHFTIEADLDLFQLNLHGAHVIANKGGRSIVCQGGKKAQTINL